MRTATAAAAALRWPVLLAQGFTFDPLSGNEELERVGDAIRNVWRTGRPLLVLIVPEDDMKGEFHPRGRWFGDLLMEGSTTTMAELSLADVVCARACTVRRVLGLEGTSEPLFMLIELDGLAPSLRELDATLHDGFTDTDRQERQATLERLVHEGIAPTIEVVHARAVTARARASGPDESVAAVVLERALASADDRGALLAALAAESSARLRDVEVRGSYWAELAGCGNLSFIGHPELERWISRCGAGATPIHSRRFLYWALREEADAKDSAASLEEHRRRSGSR